MVSVLLLNENYTIVEKIRKRLDACGDVSCSDYQIGWVTRYADLLRELDNQVPNWIVASSCLITAVRDSPLAHLRRCYPQIPLIVTATTPSVKEAVSVMRHGASHYIDEAQVNHLLLEIIRDQETDQTENHGFDTDIDSESDGTEAHPSGETSADLDDAQHYSLLRSRLSRQAILANLTRQALIGIPIDLLFKHTIDQLEQVFDVDYSEVLELVSYQHGFVLRAGKGWPDDAIDQMTVSTDTDAQAGYTLLSDAPIIIRDIHHDSRLTPEKLIYPTPVSSLISTLISGSGGQPFGLVSIASPEPNRFIDEDGTFLQAIANTLAMAIERKQSEQSLRTHANELACITTVLAKTNHELADRNRELNEFAYVIAHDLKAPLRAIANLSEWIEDDLRAFMEPETSYHMVLLRKRVHRIERLLNGLLQYSRVGRIRIVAETVSTAAILKDVIDLLSPPVNFRVVIGDNMPVFKAKRVLLHQIFSNLISNSIKHHHSTQGCIEIAVKDVDSFYEFSVTDDGPGISPEYHGKIFTIFQVLEPRDKTENTGIGLAIAKKIVDTEGGEITVESAPGKGTTFRFTWPKN